MKQDYKEVESILTDFSNSYNELKKLSNDLASALRGTLQTVSDEISSNVAIGVADIGDREYVHKLSSAIKSRDAISAMKIYASCINELGGMVDARKATVAKLQERITLQDEDSPEVAVAIKKRAQYNSDIDILKGRIKFCMTRFYCLRQSVLKRICKYSYGIATMTCDEVSSIAKPIVLKYSMPMSSLSTVDNAISEVGK